ncbi:MAG: hypothetical protein COA38_11065 [Fluviicola sp.]|nr:MAG: hypothetical protein COA38_11065 [Fluviicola sp.]
MPTVQLVEDPSVKASCAPLRTLQQEVSKAYFAARKEKVTYETTVVEHTTKKGQTLGKIAKEHGVKSKDVKRTKTTKYLQVGEIVEVTKKEKKGIEVTFKKVDEASMGSTVYIVVETLHLQGEKVLINIKQGEEDVLAKKDGLVTVQQDDKDETKLTATIGDYCEEEEITNKDDFIDWAIVKIKLSPKDATKNKEWKDGLECAGTKKASLYLLIDVHSENSLSDFKSAYLLYKGFKGATDDSVIANHFLNEDGAWFTVKQSETIHIYHTGEITELDLKNTKKVSYVYHDKDDKEHDLGVFDVIEADKWKKCSKTEKTGWKKVIAGGKTRWYQYDEGKTPLVKVKLPISYNKDGVEIYLKDNTTREYMNPESYACFLGALAENGYDDVTFNGFTSKDGTGAPSVTHYNGIAGDLRYLRKDKKISSLHIDTDPDELDIVRQEKLIDALVKFGWNSFLSFNITIDEKAFILKKSTHMSHHHHHLHLNKGDFSANYK